MVLILFALFVLMLLFALVFAMLEQWEKMRSRFIAISLISVVLVVSGFMWLRYQISHSTGCAPNCAGVNLVGRDFHGLDLNKVNFVEASLSNADLSRAQLAGSDFSGSILLGVNLQGANLQDAFFLGADLSGANLAGANLTGADLSGANLSNTNFNGVDLTQTRLNGTQFNKSELVGVNLTGGRLNAIDFTGAKMNGIKLSNADLSGAVLSAADLSGAHLANSKLSGAWLNLTNLIGADLTNSDLAGASLVGADLASADLTDSNLVGGNLVGADLKGSNLNAVDLYGGTFSLAALDKLILSLDPSLLELNVLQRSRVLTDTQLVGVGFNAQTTWPNPDVATALNGAQAAVASATTVTTDTIKLGLLHSLSGPLAISELAVRDGELLAIDEINAAGGVLGKQIAPILEDGASDPLHFAEKARKLLEKDKVVALFGCWSSDSRQAVIPVLAELNSLLFYPVVYEGFESSPQVVYMGADLSQQLIPAVDYLLRQQRKKILLVGSNEVFPHTVNTIVKAQLTDAGLPVAGEVYFPLSTNDFSQLIAQMQAAPPDAILNTLDGESNIAFFQQLAAAGLTAQSLPVMSVTIAEEEVRSIGPEVMAGHLIAGNYFQTAQTPENFAFVTAYKTAYGDDRVTSDPIEAAYSAVYLWKALVEQAKTTDVVALRKAMSNGKITYAAPEGAIRLDPKTQQIYKIARVGVVRDTGLIDEVAASEAPLKPDPFLTQFKWAANLQAILKKQQSQKKSP
ncbi:MAG: transporter substrate-binding protein [Chloroflexi bacterium]|nr:transporter substrate-binding protein [Chloroflexota bacterium]